MKPVLPSLLNMSLVRRGGVKKMTTVLCSKRFWFLAVVLILFMLTAFPAAAFADENDGSAANGQDTETECSASGTPQLQDYSPPTFEAPASTDFTPTDSPQDLPAPSDSDLPGAVDTNQPAEKPVGESMTADNNADTSGTGDIDGRDTTYWGQALAPPETAGTSAESDPVSKAHATVLYFQVAEVSMSPLLNPGAIIEIVSANYNDGDMVVAQTSDGKYVVKMLSGDMLVPLGAGVSYAVADVTILGAASLSEMTAAGLEASGLTFEVAAATTSTPPGVGAGDGSEGDPYQIAIWQNLYWLSQTPAEWVSNFVQVADIGFPENIGTWDTNKGWTPIGNGTTKFTGTYDGNGYKISGLVINRGSEEEIGLFGYTDGATLTNIAIVNAVVTGEDFVGGLVGKANNTIISNSYTKAAVVGTGTATFNNCVGGLVGWSIESTISNSYTTGNVSGGDGVGGLIGADTGSTITNCYARGSVEGNAGVGGLIGGAESSTISNSHATGKVEGSGEGGYAGYGIGGLIGGSLNSIISKSYATGSVEGNWGVGGLIGGAENSTISNSYATGSVLGNSFVGGLIGGADSSNISYCYATGEVEGVGEFEGSGEGELAGYGIGGLIGLSVKTTTSDSHATGSVTGSWGVGGLIGVETSESFNSIHRSYATGPVTGQSGVGGLVGILSGSSIHQSYSTSNVVGSGDAVGGLVGVSYKSTIYDSYATGSVQGNDYVGGLVGVETTVETSATIYRSYATGSVQGNDYVGGLVGMLSGSAIHNSFAAGSVNGTSNVGRLLGSNDGGKIINSYAVLQGSHPLVGSGSAEGAGNTTIAALKNSQTYLAAGWDITGKGGEFPLLGWQVGVNSTWFMPGSHSNRGHFQDFDSAMFVLPLQSSNVALTRISGQNANAIITPAFVTGGSAADLNRAIVAYNQAKQSYDMNKGTMGAADKAVAEVELSIANAAIKALALSLAAQGGQAFDLAALISAYNNAVAVLNANRGLLTAEQIAEAEALLQAIATVISRYST